VRHEAPAWIGIRVSLAIGKVAALQDCFQRAALTVFGPDGPDPFSFCRHSLAFSGLPNPGIASQFLVRPAPAQPFRRRGLWLSAPSFFDSHPLTAAHPVHCNQNAAGEVSILCSRTSLADRSARQRFATQRPRRTT